MIFITIILGFLSLFGAMLNGNVLGTQTTETKPPVQQQVGSGSSSDSTAAPIAYTPPQSNTPLYVLPSSVPMNEYNKAPADQKDRLGKIANTPMGLWQVKSSSLITFQQNLQDAYAKGQVPIIVLYNIPKIGCGSAGAASLEEYKAWISARSVKVTSKSIVILEPDAVAMFGCLSEADKNIRIQALQYAVEAFASTPALTYVDAGHSAWVGASTMAERLKQINVTRTRGIAVNVSNYQTNESSKSYAQSILNGIAGSLGVVIDTSRNGVGAPADMQWCNASGRKLGTASAVINSGIVDAYLWVKVPGESDGTCNGGPSEGAWWLEYALGLAS